MRPRVSITEALVTVAVLALGLAAMRQGSYLWLTTIFTGTLLFLLVALLGALVGTRPGGAWVGFALFGWACFLLFVLMHAQFWPIGFLPFDLAGFVAGEFHKPPSRPNLPAAILDNPFNGPPGPQRQIAIAYQQRQQRWSEAVATSLEIGHLLMCLLMGVLGSIAGRVLAARRELEDSPRPYPSPG